MKQKKNPSYYAGFIWSEQCYRVDALVTCPHKAEQCRAVSLLLHRGELWERASYAEPGPRRDRTLGMNDAQIRDKVERADQTGKLQQEIVQGVSSLCRKVLAKICFSARAF